MLKRDLALSAMVLVSAGALAGFYLVPTHAPPVPGDEPAPGVGPREAAAVQPLKGQPDSFGYTEEFVKELKKIGQITQKQFAARYPVPKYLGKLSFDPNTAKFFNEMNAEKVKKPGGITLGRDGKETKWPDVELPGYKLNAGDRHPQIVCRPAATTTKAARGPG